MPARRFSRSRTEVLDCGVTVIRADSPLTRMLGLIGLPRLPAGVDGLLLCRTRSVHTFGMRFALDLAWLGPAGEVLRVDAAVPPRRLASCPSARAVVELPAGRAGGHVALTRNAVRDPRASPERWMKTP